MPPNPATAKARRDEIQEHLSRHVQNPDRLAESYIRYEDIKQAWSGKDTIPLVLFPAALSATEIESIQSKLLRFLSILVYLGAYDYLNDFRKNFLKSNGDLVYDDTKLPIKDREVPPIGNFLIRQRFLYEQYLFTPVCVSVPVFQGDALTMISGSD